MSQPVSLSS